MRRRISAVLCIPALLALGSAARADVISFQRAPLSNIIASLNKQYGIHIVLKGPLAARPGFLVSFSVGIAGEDTNRVQAVAALANATNVDYEKGFVVSKMPADEAVPDVKIDTNGFVVFKDKTMPVEEAIKTVAGTDNATSQIAADVTGTVTFTDTTLRAAEAAKEIAQQTHTVWRTYYALLPADMYAANPPPNLDFDTAPPAPADTTADDQSSAPDTGQTQPYQYVPSMTSPYAAAGPNGYSPYGYGASPYGYGYGTSPYGYGASPYGYGTSPYGYGASPYGNYGVGGVGFLPSYGGYGPFGGYGGPPVTFP